MNIKKVLWDGAWGSLALATATASLYMISAPQKKLESEFDKIKKERFEEIMNSENISHNAGYTSLTVRSGTNNVTFYDLLNDGRLNGISVDSGEEKGNIFDRNFLLPKYIEIVNSNLGDAPDRLYNFTWRNYQNSRHNK